MTQIHNIGPPWQGLRRDRLGLPGDRRIKLPGGAPLHVNLLVSGAVFGVSALLLVASEPGLLGNDAKLNATPGGTAQIQSAHAAFVLAVLAAESASRSADIAKGAAFTAAPALPKIDLKQE